MANEMEEEKEGLLRALQRSATIPVDSPMTPEADISDISDNEYLNELVELSEMILDANRHANELLEKHFGEDNLEEKEKSKEKAAIKPMSDSEVISEALTDIKSTLDDLTKALENGAGGGGILDGIINMAMGLIGGLGAALVPFIKWTPIGRAITVVTAAGSALYAFSQSEDFMAGIEAAGETIGDTIGGAFGEAFNWDFIPDWLSDWFSGDEGDTPEDENTPEEDTPTPSTPLLGEQYPLPDFGRPEISSDSSDVSAPVSSPPPVPVSSGGESAPLPSEPNTPVEAPEEPPSSQPITAEPVQAETFTNVSTSIPVSETTTQRLSTTEQDAMEDEQIFMDLPPIQQTGNQFEPKSSSVGMTGMLEGIQVGEVPNPIYSGPALALIAEMYL